MADADRSCFHQFMQGAWIFVAFVGWTMKSAAANTHGQAFGKSSMQGGWPSQGHLSTPQTINYHAVWRAFQNSLSHCSVRATITRQDIHSRQFFRNRK